MKKPLFFLLILLLTTACGTPKKIYNDSLRITFLDDFIIPSNLQFEGTTVGGLSGIDYANGTYYLVCDHSGNPRFYTANIELKGKKIDTVILTGVTSLERTSSFLRDKTLDLEAIRNNEKTGSIVLTSEGSIQNGKDPSIFEVAKDGSYISHFNLPAYFLAEGEQKPRNNGVFEGLAESYDTYAWWAGMELPLVEDGSKPKLFPTKSPIRITRFEKESREASRQFILQLGNITKIPWLYFAVNGLTELLEYAPDRFLVLERAFSAGHGTNGNTVRLFDIDARGSTNTLGHTNLRKADYSEASKKLVFNFKHIRKDLKEKIIDNIEGMTFGPDLPNGNKTLLLVSDDNFSSLGRQITQIILLEVEIRSPGITNLK
ncbi:esterase-like activity of phytase family protein [Antarcticibacterium arcticum]|uniref:Esterase-like activity of phytase family protein n=1 Tax=Antarcticibacterium arcticum TaxID=2585771 RepID=A0A5B8YHU9_9FLAO|nr:esterase-like activity of phytase family protein [Antarcticibacterium arcticum]QED37520.1 esterase-like activity of phytase family protein [Antarcticibacterium arcticum]